MARQNRLGGWVLLLAVVIAAAGCSSSPKGADGGSTPTPDSGAPPDAGVFDAGQTDAGPSLPLSQFAAQYISAWCQHAVRCTVGDVFDQQACVAEQTALANGYNGAQTMVALADAGSVTYDPMLAAACVSDLAGLACSAQFQRVTDIASCAAALAGQVGDSVRCVADVACQPGEICYFSSAFTQQQVCGGFCGAQWSRCTQDSDCDGGQVCLEDNECQPPMPAPGTEGNPCGYGNSCTTGLGCFDDPSAVCEPFGDVAGTSTPACDSYGHCPSVAGTQLVCQSTSINGVATKACFPPLGLTAPGGTCNATGAQSCQPGYACIPNNAQTMATCQVPLQMNQPCTTAFQCGGLLSTTWCSSSGTCVMRPEASAPCTPTEHLCDVTTSWCNTSMSTPTCEAFAAAGGACTANDQCGPPWLGSTCAATDGGSRICAAAPAPACSP